MMTETQSLAEKIEGWLREDRTMRRLVSGPSTVAEFLVSKFQPLDTEEAVKQGKQRLEELAEEASEKCKWCLAEYADFISQQILDASLQALGGRLYMVADDDS